MINWDVTKEDNILIGKIVQRAIETITSNGGQPDALGLSMDITACHLNGCPLNLSKLLNADDFNFSHDIMGISQHINRHTGKLGDCFLPRCTE